MTLKKLPLPWLPPERSYGKFLKEFKAGVWICSQQLSETMGAAQESSFLSLWPPAALPSSCPEKSLLTRHVCSCPRPSESPCPGLSSHGECPGARQLWQVSGGQVLPGVPGFSPCLPLPTASRCRGQVFGWCLHMDPFPYHCSSELGLCGQKCRERPRVGEAGGWRVDRALKAMLNWQLCVLSTEGA